MNINVLGCSGGIGAGLRTTSLKINTDILIDCGTGVGDMSLEELSKIRHVFLTHSHLDHIAGLPLLLDSIYEYLLDEPLTLYCQQETFDVLMEHIFNWKVWPNFFCIPNEEKPVVRFQPLKPEENITINGTNITMVEVLHTVPAVAYILQSGDKSFAFTGDTARAPKLWNALNQIKQVDMLIVECSFAEHRDEIAQMAMHFSPSSLAEALSELKHDPLIYISHMQPGQEELIMAEIQSAMPHRKLKSISSGDIISL
ncbi:MAG: 3',5'-cyclic-nucleotide phosphodiesterase [Pseudomonadota bacterium]